MNRKHMKRGRIALTSILLVFTLLFGTFGAPTPVRAASKKTSKAWMTGIYKSGSKTALFKNGKIVRKANGYYKSSLTGKRYYLKKGVVNKKFTGIVRDRKDGKYYFLKKGKENRKFTGVARNPKNGKWYFVRKGVYDASFTGVCKSSVNRNWYYCKNGELDWDFTGVAPSVANGRMYYVKDGQLDWTYSGTVTQDGRTYTVTKGVAKYNSTAADAGVSAAGWTGEKLTRRNGTIIGPSGKETYYNLNMNGIIRIMRRLGNNDEYWVRADGVKMLGDYVMVAADLSLRPRGSYIQTSLGMGIVVDTGSFIYTNPTQLDIAVDW